MTHMGGSPLRNVIGVRQHSDGTLLVVLDSLRLPTSRGGMHLSHPHDHVPVSPRARFVAWQGGMQARVSYRDGYEAAIPADLSLLRPYYVARWLFFLGMGWRLALVVACVAALGRAEGATFLLGTIAVFLGLAMVRIHRKRGPRWPPDPFAGALLE